jgi:hypothetical protein
MCAPAIGSQLYNFLFGFVYDKELKHQTGKVCHGISCFTITFITGAISSGVCIFILSIVIYRNSLHKYQTSSFARG